MNIIDWSTIVMILIYLSVGIGIALGVLHNTEDEEHSPATRIVVFCLIVAFWPFVLVVALVYALIANE